jgi:hypothetical protein
MPPALDRLLASPSAVRLLRSLVHGAEWPKSTARCAHCKALQRHYSPISNFTAQRTWPRWKGPSRPKDTGWNTGRKEGADRQEEVAEWAQELQLQERLHGLNGIENVWNSSRELHLPTEDTPDAEFLWGTFVKHPDLVFPLIDQAIYLYRKTGTAYPHLYELCMGHWLAQERHVGNALEFHYRMLRGLKLQEFPLRHLARLGSQRFAPRAYEVMMEIYQESNERNLYDDVIPALLARGSNTMVKQWHTLCVRRGDLPSSQVASHPLIQALTVESPELLDTESGMQTVAGAMQYQTGKLNDQLLRRLQGRDIAPVRFDDATCARMFATRAFPPDAVIKGIAMVGVNEIGPLAVRAMAARTDPLVELPQRFMDLKAVGIALQGCVFSLALEKFATEKQWLLVRSMMESDQHPEVYDDPKLQKELLDYYLLQQDWAQSHRTLAILSLFHNDASSEAWNILLQAHVRSYERPMILQTLQTMLEKDVMLTTETILAIKGCLRRRQRGHKPGKSARGKFDDLRFVVRVFIFILEGGMGQIPPTMWRETIRRYGMLGRVRELRRLIFWLMCWYAPRHGTEFGALPKPASLNRATAKLRTAYPRAHDKSYFSLHRQVSRQESIHHPIRQLFPPSFQQGLIIWGFRAGLLPNATLEQSMLPPTLAKKHYRPRLLNSGTMKRLDWSVGLRLLVDCRDMGLHVHRHTVIKALQMMFQNLFGRGRSSKKENRVMWAANTIRYADYVCEVNEIWGSPLLRDPQLYGRSRMHSLMWHPRLERKTNRRSLLHFDEIFPEWKVEGNNHGRRVGEDSSDVSASEELEQASETSTGGRRRPHRRRWTGPSTEGLSLDPKTPTPKSNLDALVHSLVAEREN